jgi:hypothetical protein
MTRGEKGSESSGCKVARAVFEIPPANQAHVKVEATRSVFKQFQCAKQGLARSGTKWSVLAGRFIALRPQSKKYKVSVKRSTAPAPPDHTIPSLKSPSWPRLNCNDELAPYLKTSPITIVSMRASKFQMNGRSCRRRKVPGSTTLSPLLRRLTRKPWGVLIDKSAPEEESRNIAGVISVLLVGVSIISFLRRGDHSSPPRMQRNSGLKASVDDYFQEFSYRKCR